MQEEGKRGIRRRRFRTILYIIGNGLLGMFLTLGRFGFDAPMKYLLSTVSIPMEIINLIAQIKNLIDKKKPFWVFFIIILTSLLSMAVLSMTDAVKWGGWTTGLLHAVASAGPFFFTGMMAVATAMNVAGVIIVGRELYKNPAYRTPLKKLSLANRIVKTASSAILGALMIPFAIFLMTNPLGATLMLSLIVATVVVSIAWRIVRNMIENARWKKTAHSLLSPKIKIDPYEALGIERSRLEEKVQQENAQRKTFFFNLRYIVVTGWRKMFGTEAQKKEIEQAEKNTSSGYIKQCYEKAFVQCKTRVEEDALKNIYDLLRKPKSRLIYDRIFEQKAGKSIVHYRQNDAEAEGLLEAALEEEQYAPIYQGEPIAHVSHIPNQRRSSSPLLQANRRAEVH